MTLHLVTGGKDKNKEKDKSIMIRTSKKKNKSKVLKIESKVNQKLEICHKADLLILCEQQDLLVLCLLILIKTILHKRVSVNDLQLPKVSLKIKIIID